MIEDDELRNLFRAESDEHLSALEAGLLALEQGRGDSATLDQVFRDAHSLKGAARMLELQDIETLMHGIEGLLRSARDHQQSPDAAALEALYPALDAVKELAAEAVTGRPASVARRGLIDTLKAAEMAQSKATAPHPLSAPRAHAERPSLPADPVFELPADANGAAAVEIDVAVDIGTHSAPDQVDTIRVDTRKLDDLLRLCGELIVTQ
jgi:two-component system chemotaxis sensor kinase CheA